MTSKKFALEKKKIFQRWCFEEKLDVDILENKVAEAIIENKIIECPTENFFFCIPNSRINTSRKGKKWYCMFANVNVILCGRFRND